MIGDKIRQLRTDKNMTQMELAAALGLKSQSTIAAIEINKNKPSSKLLIKISKYFGVSLDYLMTTEEKLDITIESIDKIMKMAEDGLKYIPGKSSIKSNIEKIDDYKIDIITDNFKNEKFTEEEQKEIIDFIKFVISKRENKSF